MFKSTCILSLSVLLTSVCVADEVDNILKKADLFRIPASSIRADARVELFKNDVLNKERRYTIYIKPGRRSLVLMRSPNEVGQKLLMLSNQFWLLMPESQRPLRITANQKLLGEASTGDIAHMTWSGDYKGRVVEQKTKCPAVPNHLKSYVSSSVKIKNNDCSVLDLQAAQNGVTYAKIKLYVEANTKLPVKADLYVDSGKRAKQAWYFADRVNGRDHILKMVLFNEIETNQRTVVYYNNISIKEAPDEFFNPAALIRNALTGW